MKFKAVIFDLFGTLVNNPTVKDYQQLILEMASILKVPLIKFADHWKKTSDKRTIGDFKTIGDNIKYICSKLKIDVKDEHIKEVEQIRFDYIRKKLIPDPDILKILLKLKKNQFKLALISNCSSDVPTLWKYTQFAKIFDLTIFSSSIGLKKPDFRIYKLACEKLDVKPESCLYIGDGDSHELEGASQVGLYPIMIEDPFQKNAYHIDIIEWKGERISNMNDIFKFLLNI